MQDKSNPSSEEELVRLRDEGKISEEEYQGLLAAMQGQPEHAPRGPAGGRPLLPGSLNVVAGLFIVGGIFAGLIYQIVQFAYITFQIGVSRYGAIYGSFAALPLFLIWLQISWLIVLFGAEISFAFQNVHTYEFEPDCLRVKPSFKKLLALRIAHSCIKNFSNLVAIQIEGNRG